MRFTSLVLRIWWEPGGGLRASVRGVDGSETLYFKSLEELSLYFDLQAQRLKKEPESEEALKAKT